LAETAVILVATDTDAGTQNKAMAGRVTDYLSVCLPDNNGIEITVAPADGEALMRQTGTLINNGAKRIILMFTQGERQITAIRVSELQSQYPDITFHIAGKPLDATGISESLADSLEEYSPEVYGDLTVARVKPADIEAMSMALIELLLGKNEYTGRQGDVVKRMVHAAGDGSIAGSIRIHSGAVEAAIKAIKAGSPIVTDSRMTSAGINRAVSDAFGCRIHCALDAPEIVSGAAKWKLTRSAAGIRLLAEQLPGSIVVIGNAPTALMELLRLAREDGIILAVIVGIPVGFVQAREAKMALMQQAIPYITVAGSRGGSALASSAMNALRILAENTDRTSN
jgi:precorrin-8X/cobalt-precorrin-8 methylmutase